MIHPLYERISFSMKNLFRCVSRILPFLAICIVTCAFLAPASAFAAPLTLSQTAHSQAVGCLVPDLVEIDNLSLSFADRNDPQKTFNLRVNLFGTYNNKGEYCGKMKAEALILEPAHTLGGTLTVRLQQGDAHDLDVSSVTTSGGGLNGLTTTVDTSREATTIGRVDATYQSQDGTQGFIETNPIRLLTMPSCYEGFSCALAAAYSFSSEVAG